MHHFTPYNIYGIIGYPLGHSLSPLLHTTSFNDLKIPAVLVPWAFPPEKINTFFDSFKLLNIQGCCVTIPHKQAVIPFLDEISDRVKKIGAANLIYRDGDKLCGENTDVLGFMEPLQKNPPAENLKKVLLIGAGGAARAAVVAMKDLGYDDITITGVNPKSPATLAKEFGLKTVEWDKRGQIEAHIIINSTPLGMTGKFEHETVYEKAWFKGQGIAYDIVYTPFMTKFLKEAEEAGWRIISGLDMFIGQANAQFKIWTGYDLSDNAKQAVIDSLANK